MCHPCPYHYTSGSHPSNTPLRAPPGCLCWSLKRLPSQRLGSAARKAHRRLSRPCSEVTALQASCGPVAQRGEALQDGCSGSRRRAAPSRRFSGDAMPSHRMMQRSWFWGPACLRWASLDSATCGGGARAECGSPSFSCRNAVGCWAEWVAASFCAALDSCSLRGNCCAHAECWTATPSRACKQWRSSSCCLSRTSWQSILCQTQLIPSSMPSCWPPWFSLEGTCS